MFWNKKDIKSVEFKDVPIIQIGVGGAPSSGKTLLIDALFRLMGSFRPDYLKGTKLVNANIIELKEVDDFFQSGNNLKGYYDSVSKLNQIVSDKFHSLDIATDDNSIWDENTYKALLTENNQPKIILLVRNISGEMFSTYFSTTIQTVNLQKTLNDYYDEFVNKLRNEKLNFSTPAILANLQEQNIDAFIKHITDSEKINVTAIANIIPQIKKYFFAFCFFKGSKYFIYTLEVLTENASHLANATSAIVAMEKQSINSYYAVTKIDKCFINTKIINNAEYQEAAELAKSDYNLTELTRIESKDDYWKVMRFIYEQIYFTLDSKDSNENIHPKNILLKETDQLLALFESSVIPPAIRNFDSGQGNVKDNIFFITVAYHKERNFIPFDHAYNPAGGYKITDFTCWHRNINNSRMPLGALELWLRLLNELGFDLKKLNILPNPKNSNEIWKKIIGTNPKK